MADFDEFTEAGFRALIVSLKSAAYRFVRYGEAPAEPHVLWRHDVDFSMHRAAALARIEADEGAIATYFVNPRSPFYNLLEPEVNALLRGIAALGHEIGLHFDAGAYAETNWDEARLIPAVARERSLLETILEMPLRTMSWHNPDIANLLDFGAESIAGLINAYSARLRRDYAYGSDSNGVWRYQPMRQVILSGHPRLHLLTHPEWWTPEPLSPSDRVDRAVFGRARRVRRQYDDILRACGRSH
ncbi:MAG: hypothetical protein JNK46_06655 [Methylobacteriaceae bacterium]|nr:hypothetical protein [Methylobacteriaceae bacterium]